MWVWLPTWTMQCVAACCSMLQCVLQCVLRCSVCCNVLFETCRVPPCPPSYMQCGAVCCSARCTVCSSVCCSACCSVGFNVCCSVLFDICPSYSARRPCRAALHPNGRQRQGWDGLVSTQIHRCVRVRVRVCVSVCVCICSSMLKSALQLFLAVNLCVRWYLEISTVNRSCYVYILRDSVYFSKVYSLPKLPLKMAVALTFEKFLQSTARATCIFFVTLAAPQVYIYKYVTHICTYMFIYRIHIYIFTCTHTCIHTWHSPRLSWHRRCLYILHIYVYTCSYM